MLSSISALIALEGLSIVWVCFTKSGLILSDEDVYRQNTACIMAKLYLLKIIISFSKRKWSVVNSRNKVKRAA